MTAPDATPARGDDTFGALEFFANEEWRIASLEHMHCAATLRAFKTDPDDERVRVRTVELDNTLLRRFDALTAERDALAQRVRELEADRELLDYMEQKGSAWSRAPMRAVRGTEWCVRAEHDVGDTPTLREVLRISRSRDALRATPTPEAGLPRD